MTINDLIQKATDIINEHNNALAAGDTPVDASAFFTALRRDGGTTPEALAAYTAEDLRSLGVPRGVAKRLAAVFSPPAVATPAAPAAGMPGVLTKKLVATMSPRALVEHYDPADPLSMVLPRLREIAGDARFVVFTADEKAVDVDATTKLLQEVINEEAPRSVYDGRAVHPLGHSPAKALADECPLHPGEPLRSDGTCPTIERVIVGVPDARILIHLAIARTREERSDTPKAAHDAADMLERPDALDAMRRRYPRALVEMQRVKATGSLPALKVQRGQGAAPGRPFGDDVAASGGANGDLLDRLKVLLPAQFDEVVFRSGVPAGIVSPASAPMASRAVELIRWAEGAGQVALVSGLVQGGRRFSEIHDAIGGAMPVKRFGPIKVLLLWARNDESMMTRLRGHLAQMIRSGEITIRSMADIPFGTEIESERARMEREADVVLVGISADLNDTGDGERTAALASVGKLVIPVLLRPMDWKFGPLGRFQPLPANGIPVSRWPSVDEALADVAQGLRQVVNTLRSRAR